MRISIGNFDSIFLSQSFAHFEPQKAKMRYITETVCQCNSSETALKNFVKLCSYEGHTMLIGISTGNFGSIFFSELSPF